MCDSEVREQVPQRKIQRSQQEIQLLQNSPRPERVMMQKIGHYKQYPYLRIAIDSMPQKYLSFIKTKLSQIELVNEDKQTSQGIQMLRNFIKNRNQLKRMVSKGHFQNKHKQYCFINIMENSLFILLIIIFITLIILLFSLFILTFIDSHQRITFYECHVHLKFIDQVRQIQLAKFKTIDEKYNESFLTPLVQKKSIKHYSDQEMWIKFWLTFKYFTIGSFVFSLLIGNIFINIKDYLNLDMEQKTVRQLGGHLRILPSVSNINAQNIQQRRYSYYFY